ncbi:Ku protein [Mycolicibacterium sp. S2-37]|uniref:non-homologous end joining protein Ku n=1 Tax=Mycolicibacterium sp. S2-37 TaxID=2810297 RepID=UPI001A94FB2C|nr:Ku protein [Mycolicibacterium sp. S2-37]MBO0676817.1 Ku protein [Mycolicibacterium sp. S2-37]
MRAIWTGAVSFGLVNVPVKLYGATEDHDTPGHQVHDKDNGRIRYKRVCEECGEVVEYANITKGYEYGDQTIVLTADDLSHIAAERDKVIDVLEFVPADAIDPLMYDKAYYLGPQKGADKAYNLLTATLARVERVALVKFAMRSKTRLAALRVLPKEGVLVAHTLRWPDEVRHATEVKVSEVEVSDKELNLAEMLVESMANEFNPDRYRDTYQEELRELLALKAEGAELPVVEESETEDVSDLLAALEASIKGKGK